MTVITTNLSISLTVRAVIGAVKDYAVLMVAVGLIMLLALPQVRALFEQYMVTHMLIQLPLLVILGMVIGCGIAEKYRRALPYCYALPLLLIALFNSMFWMLPKVLDASLEQTPFIAAKFLLLPCLSGLPAALAWKNTGPITQAFFITNLLSMLVVLAWLYIQAPVRLCNYYLVNEQQHVGEILLYMTALIALWWALKLFTGNKICCPGGE